MTNLTKLNGNARLVKCQALDSNGVRCGRMARYGVEYFGSDEFYGYFTGAPGWVKVFMCYDHACKTKPDEMEKLKSSISA